MIEKKSYSIFKVKLWISLLISTLFLIGCTARININQLDLNQLSNTSLPIRGILLVKIPPEERSKEFQYWVKNLWGKMFTHNIPIGQELYEAITDLGPKLFVEFDHFPHKTQGHLLLEISGNIVMPPNDGKRVIGYIQAKAIGMDGKVIGNYYGKGKGDGTPTINEDKNMFYNAYVLAFKDVMEQLINDINIQSIINKELGEPADIAFSMELENTKINKEQIRIAEEKESKKKPEIADAETLKIYNSLINEDQANPFKASVNAYKKAHENGYLATKLPGFTCEILVIDENNDAEHARLPNGQGPLIGSARNKTTLLKEIAGANQEKIVVLHLMKPTVISNVLDELKVNSTYISEYVTKDNPEYTIAYQNYRDALNYYNQVQLQANLEESIKPAPGSVLGALGSGLSKLGKTLPAANRVDETKAILQNTPRTINVPIEQDYTYNVMKVKTTKTEEFHVYIIDPKKNIVYRKTNSLILSKNFTLQYGYNNKDKGSNEVFSKESDVNEFEKNCSDIVPSINNITDSLVNTDIKDYEIVKLDNAINFFHISNKPQEIVEVSNKMSNKINRLFNSVVAVQDNGGKTIGTGFFVFDNIILTNEHVVGDRKIVSVKTYDKKLYAGKVVDKHSDLDLSLIKIQGKGEPLEIYSGVDISEGSEVIAIGNPLGLEYSVSKGIVSSIRERKEDKPLAVERLYIQTDVPINPGNSGGPLFLNGQVIGVNTIKLVRKDVEGIGFAIHYKEIDKYLREMGIIIARGDKQIVKPGLNSDSHDTLSQKLHNLKSLYNKKLIDDDEYKQKKAQLLEQL